LRGVAAGGEFHTDHGRQFSAGIFYAEKEKIFIRMDEELERREHIEAVHKKS
jgi:hypothetical protein